MMDGRRFNDQYPIGTAMDYAPVMGAAKTEPVTVESRAWMLTTGELVVMVSGRTGCVSTNHLTAKPAKENQV